MSYKKSDIHYAGIPEPYGDGLTRFCFNHANGSEAFILRAILELFEAEITRFEWRGSKCTIFTNLSFAEFEKQSAAESFPSVERQKQIDSRHEQVRTLGATIQGLLNKANDLKRNASEHESHLDSHRTPQSEGNYKFIVEMRERAKGHEDEADELKKQQVKLRNEMQELGSTV